MKIQEFISRLENEIKKTKDSHEQANQLSRLKAIMEKYNGQDKLISSFELAEKIKTRPEELKIMSGWSGLDSILKGFRLKQLITIAAPTKSGKSSFCVDLTGRLKEYNPLWFPFEEGAEELIQKFLDRNEQPPLFYTPETTKVNNLDWIEEKIIEAIAKFDSKIVFIDHLHFIVPFSQERQDLKIGETMRALKGLAKKWDIVIFLIAHLKKTKLDTHPDLEDLRDSSFVAQESDTVIMIWRQTEKGKKGEVVITDNVNVSVQANRRTGKTGNIKMIYDNGKFIEKEWSRDTEDKIENETFGNFKSLDF